MKFSEITKGSYGLIEEKREYAQNKLQNCPLVNLASRVPIPLAQKR